MRKHYFLTAILLLVISVSIFALNKINFKEAVLKNIKSSFNTETLNLDELLPPSAGISGTTTVCQNSTQPEITFTSMGGTAPYTINYTLNGTTQTITSTGNSTTVSASTNEAGTFVYRLVSITDGNNNTSAINGNATVEVTEPPMVDFNFNNVGACSGTPISFTSNASGNNPFTYNWDFGDGETSTNANPSHIFEALGCGTESFNVELTVTDSNGCTTTITKSINVLEKPLIQFIDNDNRFDPFNNCGNNTTDPSYTINVGLENSSPCVNSYNVNWGDDSPIETGVTFPATHTYTQLGSFNMNITGIGNNCDNTVTYLIKNSSNPTGSIVNPGNTVNLCTPIPAIDFAIGSWATNPPDTNYNIDFGDGTIENYTQDQLEASTYFNSTNPANSQNFPIPHTYTETSCPDSYTVVLTIITSCGQTNLTAGPIIILRKPEIDFEDLPISCVNTSVQFENTSLDGYSNNCSINDGYYWDFGDGSTSTVRNPSHVYTAPGTYTVSLYGENSCGVTNTVTKTICIEPELAAAFTLNTNNGCTPLAIQTTNTTDLSESCGGETYLWEVNYASGFCGTSESWNFTSGTDENSASPAFNFLNAGTYTLTLTTENSCGTNSTSETIEVKRPPTATINSISNACGSASISPVANIDACAPNSETVTYNWSFPGGTPSSANTLDPGTIVYATPADYQITFSITNGCGTTTDTEDFSVNPIPTVTNTDLTQTICSGTDTTEILLTSDIASTTFNWIATAPNGVTGFTASGNTDAIPTQTIFNTNTTSEDVTFVITPSVDGCDGTPVNLIITVDPAPAFTNQPDSESLCLNGSISQLSVSVNGPGTPTYQWYSNTTNSNSGGNELTGETASTYTPPNNPVGTFYYYCVVSFSSGAGCNEIISDIATIEIVDGIQIDTNPTSTQSLCVGGTLPSALTVTHSGGTGTISYQWFSNTTNSNTGGTSISSATNSTYTPPAFNAAGTYYYYVMITLNGSGCSPISSDVAEIIVAEDPTITSQPQVSQTLCQGITPQDLEVTVSGGLGTTYTYQWYSNSTNSNTGGNIISGATNTSYTPATVTVGTLYYYAVISQPGIDCSVVSNPAEVTVNPAPNFTTQPASNTYCLGDTLNQLSVNYENGVGTPTYQWYSNTVNNTSTGSAISGETNSNFNPPSATVGNVYYYAVITFSSGGCTQITSNVAEITINQTPNISNKSDIICSGNTFTITPDSTSGDIAPTGTTYVWATPTINPAGTITGASSENSPKTNISQTLTNTTTSPSTVTYSVTPTSGTCVGNTFEVEITVNPSISITSSQTNSNCYSANTGDLDIEIVGGVPFSIGNPYQISWTGPNGFTSTNEDISNLEPGDYTVAILDDGGCPFTENFTITEPNELVFSTIDFNPETISCFNADNGSISIEISGGTAPYTYSWTRNNILYATTEDLTNLSPGEYEVTVTDASNCPTISRSFSVVEPEELVVGLVNQVNVICFGDATGEININTVGGRTIETSPDVFDYSYSWTGPNGFTSNQQNLINLIAGTYTVTVTDRSNCTDTLELVLTETDEIIIEYTATEIECYNDNDATINITNISGGNSPYTVAWSNLGSGMSQSNLSPGDYTITVTDNTNCEKAVTITIVEPPIFTINPTTNNVSCFGESDGRIILNLVGGITPVNLVWDDDPTAGVERNNIGPGTYTVTITDSKPCVITETFTITEPNALSLSANTSDALNCDDANSGSINLIVTGGTPPFTYSWSNGDTTEDLTNIPPGNYAVNVTDANNCETSGTWQINRFEPLEVSVDTNTIYDCDTKTINQTFVAMVSGGVPPYNINWSNGTVSGTNGEFMNTTQNGLVIISVTDNINCSTSFSYNVDIPMFGDPDFSVTSSAISTYGFYSIEDPIEFTNLATGDYESISWDFGDGNFSSDENPTHIYNNEGSYSIIQTVSYPFGCVYTKQFTLVVEKGYKIIMPNAFTPNGDGMNAYFVPESIALNTIVFNIYDTWGSLIYSEEGDTIKGWDGKINDAEAENGNYYFTFSAKTFYGKTITQKGAFVSIK
ncbi:PKD domain-containing protein [Algibacter pectinivorans]|uniref:Gliding motility-associated C-terminal domain-containing protein n=1 Tax=Algibacter pectinivorans TaxID=870482 RepID=A0A1I1P7Z5_9FLAO|nr:PKD domain-containing protein [Algibacter pectinivorans]SFD06061.1 gliding motility-associated C-terminal domain-containing protein [Algibacter pectinivorans]